MNQNKEAPVRGRPKSLPEDVENLNLKPEISVLKKFKSLVKFYALSQIDMFRKLIKDETERVRSKKAKKKSRN